MNQNSINDEIKSRMKLANTCYNLLSFSLLSKNAKIKIYKTIIFSVVLYGCETCVTHTEEGMQAEGFRE
jgi:hypothetical protein